VSKPSARCSSARLARNGARACYTAGMLRNPTEIIVVLMESPHPGRPRHD
jgi:hypothetical protein